MPNFNNRIKKILYYLKKGRINVFANAALAAFFGGILYSRYDCALKKRAKDVIIFPVFSAAPNSAPAEPRGSSVRNSAAGAAGSAPSAPQVSAPQVSVSIIVPAYNQWDYTYMCLESIYENTPDIPYEIILADDNSSDETAEAGKYVKNAKIIRNGTNLGFLKNCNNAAGFASGRYILFLNNDVEVQKNWLKELLSALENDETAGMAGPKFIYPNGVLLEAGGIIWRDAESWQYGRFDDPGRPEYNRARETDYISGACLLIRKELFEDIGGFDERYAPAYYEDSDLAFEVRKRGYGVIYEPRSTVVHFENVSYKKSAKKKSGAGNGAAGDSSGSASAPSGASSANISRHGNKEKFIKKWKLVLENEHYEQMTNISAARNGRAARTAAAPAKDGRRGGAYGEDAYGEAGYAEDDYRLRHTETSRDAGAAAPIAAPAVAAPAVAGSGVKTRRILIDCSETYASDLNTGIQRVVRNIVSRSERISKRLNIPVIPVVLSPKGYVGLEPFLKNGNSRGGKNGGTEAGLKSVVKLIFAKAVNVFKNKKTEKIRANVKALKQRLKKLK